MVKRIKPDILHCHYVGNAGWWGALSGFHPLVLTAMGSDVLAEAGAYEGVLRKIMTRYTIRKADLITAGAQYTLDALKPFAQKETPLRLIRRGVDFAVFHPYTSPPDLRNNLSIDNEFKIILSPRGLQPLYNIDTIVKAIPLVLKEIPHTIFVFIDSGAQDSLAYKRALVAQIKALGITESVKFIRKLEHQRMPDLYNLADVVISVPISDSQPSTIFEAMACGRPIVVGDLPCCNEVFGENETALLVPTKDHRALAKALISLLRDQELGRRIGMNGLSLVKQIGDFYTETKRLERLYQELLHQKSILRATT